MTGRQWETDMDARGALNIFQNFCIFLEKTPDIGANFTDDIWSELHELGLYLSGLTENEANERKRKNIELHYAKQIQKLQNIRDQKLAELETL